MRSEHVVFQSVSCKDNVGYVDVKSYFTFTTDITSVLVDQTDKFLVSARKSSKDDKSTLERIVVLECESTATAGVHFILPEKMEYTFPVKSTAEQSIEFTLIPENITEEVVLVLSKEDNGYWNLGRYTKTKVHIFPKTDN